MDEKDVQSPGEWGPASSLSEGWPTSLSSSSHSFFSPLWKFEDHASADFSIDSRLESAEVEGSEPFIWSHLTSDIQKSDSLQPSLHRASITFQRQAKWFTPSHLAVLLDTAITRAGYSKSTADLYSNLDLIDTICTFSVLPAQSLGPVTRFLAYSYYQGSRMNKHRNLAAKSWTVLDHILQSHLGSQSIAALLDILTSQTDTKAHSGFAAVSGVLKLLEKRFTLGNPDQQPNSNVSVYALLPSLRNLAHSDDVILREQVVMLIHQILSGADSVDELFKTATWDDLLELVQLCSVTDGDEVGSFIWDRISEHSPQFEPHLVDKVAWKFISFDRSLTKAMSRRLIEMLRVERLTLPEDVGQAACPFELLSGSAKYPDELAVFIECELDQILSSDDEEEWTKFIQRYVQRTTSETVPVSASIACASAITNILYTTMKRSRYMLDMPTWKVLQAFNAASEVASSAATPEARICALQLLYRIRAAVTGRVWIVGDDATDSSMASPTMPCSLTAEELPLDHWLEYLLAVVDGTAARQDDHTLAFVLAHLPEQLCNLSLFTGRSHHIKALYKCICAKLTQGSITNMVSHVRILTTLISYRDLLSSIEERQIVTLLISTAGSSDAVSKDCIHALTICCHELPDAVTRDLDNVIQKMAQMITQKHLAIHVLEFLTGLSRLKYLFNNFIRDDFRRIFGVCISYLQSLRNGNQAIQSQRTSVSDQGSSSHKGMQEALPQYVYALAHHVIVFWYLAVKIEDRPAVKTYVTNSLCYLQKDGVEVPDDQGLVVLDFMDSVDATADNVEEYILKKDAPEFFDNTDGRLLELNRILGLLLVSTKTSLRNGKTLVTTRRPSGTFHHIINGRGQREKGNPSLANLHSSRASMEMHSASRQLMVYPHDQEGEVYGMLDIQGSPSLIGSADVLTLPAEDAVRRAIQSFDRTPGLDSHKAGVLYIGEDQFDESPILLNSSGSPDYRDFVAGLGRLQKLKGAHFNTQGLDTREDQDGKFTYVWNNDITELVYHVTTMMPTSEVDPHMSVISKKRHIGNDFVNIVFNNSGGPFKFDTFPSAFNYVYIVITPSVRTTFLQTRTHAMSQSETHRFYRVEFMARDDFPAISSAAEPKMVSGASLADYVRNLALNACVFADVWVNKDSDEYKSSWRTRLDQIRRLKERYGDGEAESAAGPKQDKDNKSTAASSKGKGKMAFWK